MNNFLELPAAFVVGFVVAALINSLPYTDASKYRDAIKECEKSLPRDKKCKAIGVPE